MMRLALTRIPSTASCQRAKFKHETTLEGLAFNLSSRQALGRVQFLSGDCPRDYLRDWRGRRRRQGKGMREEGHRILRKKLSDLAPYRRRWNAHGEGPQVGGEGRSKPSALRRLSISSPSSGQRSGRRPRSNRRSLAF